MERPIFDFNRRQAAVDVTRQGKVVEHRLHCALRMTMAPVSAGQDVRNKRSSIRSNRRLHVTYRREVAGINYPVQPQLASIRRLARLQPLVNAAQILDRVGRASQSRYF